MAVIRKYCISVYRVIVVDLADDETLFGAIATPAASAAHKPVGVRRSRNGALLIRVVSVSAEVKNIMSRVVPEAVQKSRRG